MKITPKTIKQIAKNFTIVLIGNGPFVLPSAVYNIWFI